MKASKSEGENYGVTTQSSCPAISFPKQASSQGYGKKKPYVKPHGGDQYGTTMHKSAPAINFPTKPAFAAVGKSGSAAVTNTSADQYTQPIPKDSHS